MFDDLIEANAAHQGEFGGYLAPGAQRGLAVVTCIDSRLDPMRFLGLEPGDAKVMRNAGGRVTPDVLRSLILAVHLLGVERVAIIQHTECAMVAPSDLVVHDRILDRTGVDVGDLELGTMADQLACLTRDVDLIRSEPLLPDDLPVAGFLYDVATGALELVAEP